jgi:hypothetical protein
MERPDETEEKKKRIRDEINSLGQRADELERILPNLDSQEKRKAEQRITLFRLEADRLSERIRKATD